jgi:hypothetical protein
VLSTFAHEAADALAHPAFRAPSLKGEAMTDFRAPPRRHNNRGDGACSLSARVFSGANGASPARVAVITTGAMTHICKCELFENHIGTGDGARCAFNFRCRPRESGDRVQR